MEILKDVGVLFYIISPSETAVKRIEDIPNPNYVIKAIPYFITFIVLEYILQIITNKRRTRVNDGITSMATGIYIAGNDIFAKATQHYFYIKFYESWRIADLPWDSPVTWWMAALGVDFCFYWVHRASHEMNFLWAHHQVHHSSEDFNLTTALRQPGFQIWVAWIFFLPLAFFIPPQIYMIHQQFNLLFQFWIHTEVIESLGPLEWILNTPKHHRVHHGSNRYCLDKNYAGWLIIWDRMFGTFEEERPEEKIKYGLVEEVQSFNPFWLQIFYVPKIWSRINSYESWIDKVSVLLKGPGWTPGKPRLGDINEVPIYPTRDIYDIHIPLWKNAYVLVHFFTLLLVFNTVASSVDKMSQVAILVVLLYILASLTSLGFILEARTLGGFTEFFRCSMTTYVLYSSSLASFGPFSLFATTLALFLLSSFLWIMQIEFSWSSKRVHCD